MTRQIFHNFSILYVKQGNQQLGMRYPVAKHSGRDRVAFCEKGEKERFTSKMHRSSSTNVIISTDQTFRFSWAFYFKNGGLQRKQ